MDHAAQSEAVSPLEIRPAYEVVVERLRRAILLSVYLPGDKLPPERAHAEQLGVSRVTLREAIRVLEGEGLVKARRGATGGVVVLDLPPARAELRRHLRASMAELDGLAEFRMANECCAAARAASRITGEQLADLEASIDAMRDRREIGAFRAADSSFHLGIARAADCAPLLAAVEDARIALFTPLDALDYDVVLSSTVPAHGKILTALRSGDGRRAARAMERHLRTTWEELVAVLQAEE